MTNTIIFLILIIILTAAITYIVKKKKSGVKCIGCPYSGSCSNENGCGKKNI